MPDRSSDADIVIVGGGIVGLAVARELLLRQPDLRLVLFERESAVGRHQTSHNSGVIHRGMYYKPRTLKAQLCVRGAGQMIAYCESNQIPVQQVGKLIVATTAAEVSRLDDLEDRARANGVTVARLSPGAMREVEPAVCGLGALHSPTTAIVDFSAVAKSIYDDITSAGGNTRLSCSVERLEIRNQNVAVHHAQGTTIARLVVACAGAWADSLVSAQREIQIVPFRGRYLRLRPNRRHLVRGLVYPVPDPRLPFLGTHFTRCINGEVTVGPTALPALTRDVLRRITARDLADTLARTVQPGFARMVWQWRGSAATEVQHALSQRMFVRDAARLIPISMADVQDGPSGIRAQAVARTGVLLDDFVISEDMHSIHVRNSPSPAATASLAIAEHVADCIARRTGFSRLSRPPHS